MSVIQLTQNNFVKTVASSPAGSFFAILNDITLDSSVKFPKNCVIEFMGGSISNKSLINISISLNGSIVVAAGYCIFNRDIDVDGFANTDVHAEWFKYSGCEEHAAINRALKAAAGCPVLLEKRVYDLTGSICFPKIAGSPRQTLISPGTLNVKGEFPAIILDVSNVSMQLNYLRGIVYHGAEQEFIGTGIQICGICDSIDIDAFEIFAKRGIEIVPDKREIKVKPYHLSNSRIKFQHIQAINCIYVDNGYGASVITNTLVIGGRIEGGDGIYFTDPTPETTDKYPARGLVFFNIGLEGLTGLPIKLRNVTESRFLDLRMSESLPVAEDARWIDMKNVTNVEISVKSTIPAYRIQVAGTVDRTVVKCNVLDDTSWPQGNFNMYVIAPLRDTDGSYTPQVVATSSIQPYNICKSIIVDKIGVVYHVKDILPEATAHESERDTKYYILPRTLNVEVRNNCSFTVDLTGLGRAPQCMIDLYARIETGGRMTFSTSDFPKKLTTLGRNLVNHDGSYTYTESGIYRLTWDSERQIVITKL